MKENDEGREALESKEKSEHGDADADGERRAAEARYFEQLLPIFRSEGETDWFQIACSILRVTGMAIGRWDALAESRDFLSDFNHLLSVDLPTPPFLDPDATRWRIGLVTYVHLVEMDAPYHIIANLLRVQNGLKYALDPFTGVTAGKKAKQRKKKAPPFVKSSMLLTPTDKLSVIRSLSGDRFAQIPAMFDEFYSNSIRNAIAHSDYVLDSDKFKLLSATVLDQETGKETQIIPLSRLNTIIRNAVTFYRMFFALDAQVRREFVSQGKIPFDDDGSEIEFTANSDGQTIGFTIEWPSGATSEYRDDENGRLAQNMRFTSEGIGFIEGALLARCKSCGQQLRTVPRTQGEDWLDIPCRKCGQTARETGSTYST